MTSELVREWAEAFHGREYGKEIYLEEADELKESGLVSVIVYGDDLCEFYGAINKEVGCLFGKDIYVNMNDGSLVYGKVPDNEKEYALIRVVRCELEEYLIKNGYVWGISTDIPHQTFDILRNGSKYCLGMVFSMKDLKDMQRPFS